MLNYINAGDADFRLLDMALTCYTIEFIPNRRTPLLSGQFYTVRVSYFYAIISSLARAVLLELTRG